MFRNIALIAALILSGSASAQSQTPKYGHLNLGNLLESMPETKAANEKLKVYADSLSVIDEKMTKEFQDEYRKLEQEYNAGMLTPVQVQQRQADLQKKQEAIELFEQNAQQAVAQRREELLKPLVDKVEKAVQDVAKENKYLMIFDTSSGALLFASETEDIEPLVKKKLGM